MYSVYPALHPVSAGRIGVRTLGPPNGPPNRWARTKRNVSPERERNGADDGGLRGIAGDCDRDR